MISNLSVLSSNEEIKFHTQEIQKLPYRLRLVREFFHTAGPLEFVAIEDLEKTIDDVFGKAVGNPKLLEDLCPYFAVIWPSARALSQKILNSANRFYEKTVLELGCGLGLPSFVCAKLSANVTAVDFHPEVEQFMNENRARNRVSTLKYQCVDWREGSGISEVSPGGFDFVIGSDILYERDQPEAVAKTIDRYLRTGGEFWLADPGRPYLQELVSELEKRGFSAFTEVEKTAFDGKDQEIFCMKFVKNK